MITRISSPNLAALPRRTPHGPRSRPRAATLFAGEVRRLLRLAGPIIVSQLGQVGMNTADTVMVAPLGATSLAAAGLGTALHWLGVIVCMGVLIGVSPLVSQAFGARDMARCHRVLVQGLWLALLLSLPLTLLSLAGGAVALAMGQDPVVARLTGSYLTALAPGILPLLLFLAVREYLEGMGYVRAPMLITFLGLAVNIVANRVLIYGLPGLVPALGVAGAGWATTLVRWVMLSAVLLWLRSHPRLRVHRGEGIAPERRLLGAIVRVGLPIGGQLGLETGLFSLAAVMMGWLGQVELAAHQVTINIASTTFMVALGVSMAGSIRVGQYVGARRPRRMRRAALATYLLAVSFMGLCALVFVSAPRTLIGFYTRDPAILALGARLLLLAAAFQVFDGAQVAGAAVLRGAADTRAAAVIAGVGYWLVGVPLTWLLAFPLHMGPVGVWSGLTAGLMVTALLLAWRVQFRLWRLAVEPQ